MAVNAKLTNGATYIEFRDADFQIPVITPKQRVQRIINNTAIMPTVIDATTAQQQFMDCEVLLFKDDKGTNAGADSLVSFFESTDHLGVNGTGQSFYLTYDSIDYQVRFLDNLGGGLRTVKKDSHYRGSFRLMVEPTLPTDVSGCIGWWAVWDLDNNGGDLSAWTHGDDVGGSGEEWKDKSGNSADATQSTSGFRPLTRQTGSLINNRPVLVFDGSDDRLECTPSFTNLNVVDPDWTMACVLDAASDASTDDMVSLGRTSGTASRMGMYRGGTTVWGVTMQEGVDSKTMNSGTPDTNPHILFSLSNGTTGDMFLDGNQIVTDADMDVNNNTWSFQEARIGCKLSLGTDGNFWDGRIGEVILWDRELTLMELRGQIARLHDMWQIALTG